MGATGASVPGAEPDEATVSFPYTLGVEGRKNLYVKTPRLPHIHKLTK